MGKGSTADETLSARDKALCDGFLAGATQQTLAQSHGVSRQRVSQLLRRPHAVAYLLAQGASTRALLYATVGATLLDRAERDELKTADLIALWKAAMPQEIAVTQTIIIRQEAGRIAEKLGITVAEVLAEAEAIVAGVPA